MNQRTSRILVLPFLLLLAVSRCHAAAVSALTGAPAASSVPSLPPNPSVGAALFRMAGSLMIVIALFFAAVWFFRNMHRFKAPGAKTRERKLHVLEGKSLGPRQAVYVVAYEQQRLLIGATAQGISLLTHLPEGAPAPEGEAIVPVSFGEALLHALGRK
jgi:flagellar biosynthetic protein FliO